MNTAELPRQSNAFVTPEFLRAQLKQILKLNARQVSVSRGHSMTWLTITVRDPKVDLKAVRAFAAPFHTSTVDQTDYHSGQSVRVETTPEVNDAHAAPFLEEIRAAIAVVASGVQGCGTKLSNGKYLWKDDMQGYYVTADLNGGPRGPYVWTYDVERGSENSVRTLALQMARVGN